MAAWTVTFGTAMRGLGGAAVPNITVHPSTINVPGLYHIGHTKRPYRPKGITISATKNVLLFIVNIYKLSVET